jgi:predicted site-specific integrase-resolvase
LSVACRRGGFVNLARSAERDGVARAAACRWLRAGLLAVTAREVGRVIVVDGPDVGGGLQRQMAVYARVPWADQKLDLDRQVARVTAWATGQKIPVERVVKEVGSASNGHYRKFLMLLRYRSVGGIVVEHRSRFCRFGSEYVEAAVSAQGRELLVVDTAGVDDDLVRDMAGDMAGDMAEILTSMSARLHGKRAAAYRAKRALAAVGEDA